MILIKRGAFERSVGSAREIHMLMRYYRESREIEVQKGDYGELISKFRASIRYLLDESLTFLRSVK